MTPTTAISIAIIAPQVRWFSGRQDSFIQQDGARWRRLTPEDAARDYTGYDRETRESVGIYIERRANGLLRIGFDLWSLKVNLRPAVIVRIESRWRQESASFSKPMLRSVGRRAHFSKSFMRFEFSPERIDAWKAELEHVLSNSESY